MSEPDPHDLTRFVQAQDERGVYDTAVTELRRGRKVSHWMWFVFPQLAGLGRSAMSRHYGLASLAEARAYLAHPVLGPRLLECAGVLTATRGRSAQQVFGGVDAVKLRSSMTLFLLAAAEPAPFRLVLEHWYAGSLDPATVALLERLGPGRAAGA